MTSERRRLKMFIIIIYLFSILIHLYNILTNKGDEHSTATYLFSYWNHFLYHLESTAFTIIIAQCAYQLSFYQGVIRVKICTLAFKMLMADIFSVTLNKDQRNDLDL